MKTISLKLLRYGRCYYDLTFGNRPQTLEDVIDYCVNRPVLIGQVRSEILPLARLLKTSAPKRSLEIGTNYGGTLFLLCALSPPDATIISLDLPGGAFGGGYPVRKIPLFRRLREKGSDCTLSDQIHTVKKPKIKYCKFSTASDLIIYLSMQTIPIQVFNRTLVCTHRWYEAVA
jgi:hypothetical protein